MLSPKGHTHRHSHHSWIAETEKACEDELCAADSCRAIKGEREEEREERKLHANSGSGFVLPKQACHLSLSLTRDARRERERELGRK